MAVSLKNVCGSLVLLPSLLMAMGCVSKEMGSTGSSDSNVTVTSGSGVTTLRTYRETTLTNGLRVLFLPDTSLPALSLGLLVRSGASSDPEGQAGLANFVSDLLDQGTKHRSATQISDDLGRLGATFRATVDFDYTYLALSGLSVSSQQLLANFAELATEPAFPDAEVTRIRKQNLASIERSLDNPRAVAELAIGAWVFGSHPYGRSLAGNLKQAAGLSKKNVIQHYLKFYRPNNSILVVAGKFDSAFEKNVEESFGVWSRREVPALVLSEPKSIPGVRVQVVDKAGLSQAQIRFASVGIKRKDDDFLALRVANTILGGAFASRLNDKIRKELGLTYSISSNFDSRLERGPFEISTFTKVESIDKVVTETLTVYRDFVARGITSAELDRAKGYLKGIFPQAIETSDKLAFNLVLLRLYGVPDRYLTHYIRELDSVSVSDVNSAIRRHMSVENLAVVVHAPKASTENLKTLGSQYEVISVDSLQ